jgi:signal transduction histidine kinase/integral membrane sensor domain MASE1
MTAGDLRHGFEGNQRMAPVGLAVAVCAGYYFGSLLGLELRVPPATPSVVWPPNAILTAALLLTRQRDWWIVLAAALPAHLAVQLRTDWPMTFIGFVFVTNCLEALIAAFGYRKLSDGVPRLETFDRLMAFLAAAGIAAPVLSSFADAAVAHAFVGDPYWLAWRSRLFSSVLAELTVAPGVVGFVIGVRQWKRRKSTWRAVEAAFIGVGLIGFGWTDFARDLSAIPVIRAVSTQAPFVVQLPLLLWAAVRFGPTGTGAALLTSTLLNAWSVVHGQGPFATMAAGTGVTAVTLSLIVAAVTLMCLSALLEERRHSQYTLAMRLQFEELLSGLSGTFVHLPSDQMDRALDSSLGRIGSFLRVDCLGLVVTANGAWNLETARYWRNPHAGVPPDPGRRLDFPWALQQVTEHPHVVVVGPNSPPADAFADRATLDALGLQTVLVNPLSGADRLLGALVCGTSTVLRSPFGLLSNLRLVGDVLARVLERKATEDDLRTSELMKSAILQSLTTGVVVVDREAQVLAQNETWVQLAREAGCVDAAIGDGLLDSLRVAAERGNAIAAQVSDGISAVLEGRQRRFVLEHTSDAGAETRWWTIQVVPLSGGDGGAVVTRADITDLRRAELEAQRSRQGLAHVARVSTVGELTASIAHQLNQPLTAIMTNAQVARRLLESGGPDVDQVRGILLDIVKDDRRASDVIQRLRELLRNGELEMTRIDMCAVIREVADLLSSEAIMRDVALSLNFDHMPVYTRGDRVQLQQVVLNLLQNAMESMSDGQRCGRVIRVDCRSADDSSFHVRVHDSGPGLRDGADQVIFEPFYTTKPGGMGMGLSIVRSIVEAHGGSIRAENDPAGGAAFDFTLPKGLARPEG